MKLIPRFYTGGSTPKYGGGTKKLYDHVTSIYQAFVDKGMSPLVALELTNQSVREMGWNTYATGDGKKFKDVGLFADHVINWYGRMYPNALKATDFESFNRGLFDQKHKYHATKTQLQYGKGLLETRTGVRNRINYYRQLLGFQPLAFIDNYDNNFTGQWPRMEYLG